MRPAAAVRPKPTSAHGLLIDADLHNKIPAAELSPRLPERWRYKDYGFNLGSAAGYARPRLQGAITNSWPPGGGLPRSDREFMVRQPLDRWGHDYAILSPIDQVLFSRASTAITRHPWTALNAWLEEEWIAVDPRIYGSISVPVEDPGLAVAEIEHWAGNRRFV
jgi:uncharacterized protein